MNVRHAPQPHVASANGTSMLAGCPDVVAKMGIPFLPVRNDPVCGEFSSAENAGLQRPWKVTFDNAMDDVASRRRIRKGATGELDSRPCGVSVTFL